MPAKINGTSLSDLVKREVDKAVHLQASEIDEIKSIMQAELETAHQLLLGALARITCLEEEVNKVHLSNTSSSSAGLHNMRKRGSVASRHFFFSQALLSSKTQNAW